MGGVYKVGRYFYDIFSFAAKRKVKRFDRGEEIEGTVSVATLSSEEILIITI